MKVKVSREVPLAMLARLYPGSRLPILLDPNDDEDFIILWTASMARTRTTTLSAPQVDPRQGRG